MAILNTENAWEFVDTDYIAILNTDYPDSRRAKYLDMGIVALEIVHRTRDGRDVRKDPEYRIVDMAYFDKFGACNVDEAIRWYEGTMWNALAYGQVKMIQGKLDEAHRWRYYFLVAYDNWKHLVDFKNGRC